MRFLRQIGYVTIMTSLTVGCDLVTGPGLCDPLGTDLVIGLTNSNQPEFHWMPDCAVNSLEVELVANIESLSWSLYPIWKISKTGNSGIESGVVFGEAASGTEEFCGNLSWELYSSDIPRYVPCGEGPDMLIVGTHYIVTIKSSVPYSGWFGSGHRRGTWTQIFVPVTAVALPYL